VIVGKTKYGFPIVSSSLEPGRPNSGRIVTEVKNKAKTSAGINSIIVLDAAAGIGIPSDICVDWRFSRNIGR